MAGTVPLWYSKLRDPTSQRGPESEDTTQKPLTSVEKVCTAWVILYLGISDGQWLSKESKQCFDYGGMAH